MPPRSKSTRWTVRTLADVAAFFGMAASTVKNDWRAAGMPGRPGAWDLSEVVAWRESRRQQDAMPSGLQARKLAAEVEILEERAKQLAIETAEKNGEIISLPDAQTDAAEFVSQLKAWIENWPDDVACVLPEAVKLPVLAELNHRVFNLLTFMSKWTPLGLKKLPPETGLREARPHLERLRAAFTTRLYSLPMQLAAAVEPEHRCAVEAALTERIEAIVAAVRDEAEKILSQGTVNE